MLQVLDRDALVRASKSMIERLRESGLKVIPPDEVEKHKADEVAKAPVPVLFGRLRFKILDMLDETCWSAFGRPLFLTERVFAFGPAEWKRSYTTVAKLGYCVPHKVLHAAQDAQRALPEGKLFIDELVQDQEILDPVLGIEDEDGNIAYLIVWKDGIVLDI